MRVLQIIDSLGWGGAERLQVTFAQQAHARGVAQSVISLSLNDGSPHPEQIAALGAEVMTLPSGRLLDPPRIRRIVRFVRCGGFDVIHTHLAFANILGALAGWLTGVPVVATLHSIGTDPRHYHPIRHGLELWALQAGARRVVAVGEVVAEAYRTHLPGKAIRVIPNAVAAPPPLSPHERAAVRVELAGDAFRPLLISVGRLAPPKGFDDLLTAFVSLRRSMPAACLAIVGSGVLYAELAAQIVALGLEGHARLIGARDDVPRLLAASDLYASTSRREGLPLAVLEAMAAGLPVVATPVGDLPRILDGLGVLVPPGEPGVFAQALHSLLSDPDRMQALGTAGRAYVLRHHGAARWFDEHMAVYRDACARPATLPQSAG